MSSCSVGPASDGGFGESWLTKREAKEGAAQLASFVLVSAGVK